MNRLRAAFVLLIALSLSLATVGFGMARGQAPTAGQMVICTGHGIVTVAVDAAGNPVTSHTLCPDAALATLAAFAVVPPVAAPADLGRVWRNWPKRADALRPLMTPTPGARGPPGAPRA